jgi:hypothetical protein
MPETPNHGYNVPDEGEEDWHEPLNENFEQYDTDIEIRDELANRSDYEPKAGAKFLATDTGDVALGDGSAWRFLDSTGTLPEFERVDIRRDDNSRLNIISEVGGSSSTTHAVSLPDSDSISYRLIQTVDDEADRWTVRHNGDEGSFHAIESRGDGHVGVSMPTDSPPDAPLHVGGDNNWNLSNSEGDLKIGDDDYRLAMGVALGGGGAGACNIRAKGGIEQLNLGAGDSANSLRVTPDAVSVNGDLDVSGNKNFVQSVDTDAGEREVVYTATESGTPHTEASGVAELDDGRVEVDLPDHFGWVTDADEPLHVQTTPYAVESNGLAVVERSTECIAVEDLDGTGDYEFSYTVKGTREGHAEKRVVREPSVGEVDAGIERTTADD